MYVLEDRADTEACAVVTVNVMVNNNNSNKQISSALCVLPWFLQVPLVVSVSALLLSVGSSSECYTR